MISYRDLTRETHRPMRWTRRPLQVRMEHTRQIEGGWQCADWQRARTDEVRMPYM